MSYQDDINSDLVLNSTKNSDFNIPEELRRLRRAIHEVRSLSYVRDGKWKIGEVKNYADAERHARLLEFISEAVFNIDEVFREHIAFLFDNTQHE